VVVEVLRPNFFWKWRGFLFSNDKKKVDHHRLRLTIQMGSSAKKRKAEDVELEYERLPRRRLDDGASSNKLLIKTHDGWIPQATDADNDDIISEDSSETDDEVEDPDEVDEGTDKWEGISQAKEELARLAGLINEDPEQHLGSLRALAQVAASKNHKVTQLALATQCAVFKDIIPGYRIRPLSDEESKEKVSKDIKKLRSYEQGMVSIYHSYVKELINLSRSKDEGPGSAALRSTCISCASSLLLAVPHFNFRTELLGIVLDPLNRKAATKDYDRSIQTIRTLFRDDDDGRPSLEAVSLLTKSMRTKDYQVHESLLDVFLHLRLLSEFSSRGSYDRLDRKDGSHQIPKKVRRMQEKREFKSKRARKLAKEQRAIEKDMKEPDAVVSYEERDRLQAEMLKLVFATYFRVLRQKVPHLMGSVLEGLARYAHLINQDFFGDLLEALKDLIRDSQSVDDESELSEQANRDTTRESLLCSITAFALLQGQDGRAAATNLHLDLNFFIANLFNLLIPTTMDADIELGRKSLRLDDPLSQSTPRRTKVNAKTKTVLLIRCLSSTLLPPASLRSVPPIRLAAFTKHLLTISLQLPEKSCQAMLGLLAQTSKVHGRSIAALWNTEERKGDGVFDPLKGSVEGSNPFASTVWEGELLRLHYSPKVKEALDIILRNIRAVHQ
jgi:nucleolar complex protein 3